MINLNAKTFSELISGETLSVVDFWAEWCMPCKIYAPVLEEISDELDGKVIFGKLNVDEEDALAAEYGITGIPTLVLFKGGEEKARLAGVRRKEEVVALVESFM